jgi:hypothetical protein
VNQHFGAAVERDVRLGGAGSTAAIEARSTRSDTILSARDAPADEGCNEMDASDLRHGFTFAADSQQRRATFAIRRPDQTMAEPPRRSRDR